MANSVNILLGVGLLSVPYALKQGGWAGLGVLGLLGIVTNYTGKALIRVQERGALYDETTGIRNKPLTSYEDIGEEAFGKNGRLFIAWVLYTELVGTCALFFILEGDHLSVLFDGTKYLTHSSQWWQTCSALFMVPTLWLADLSSLSYFGALGATASVSLVGVVVYELYVSFDGVLPTLESLPPGFESTSWLHLSTLPVSFGLLAFVFAGHAVFPAIYASMEKPEDYEPMLDKTYAIVGVTCAVIGAAGYALYGDAVKDEVTLNLPTGLASTIALGLIAVNPLSKFALTMDPVARGLEGNLGIDIASEKMDAVTGESDNGPFKARVLRTGLGLGALLTAAKVPFFAVFMSLIGSFLTLTVSVIFPAACHLKVFDAELSAKEKAVDWAIMFVGGFCVVAGSTSAVVDLLAK
jgi:vesicular inhibitory amino acid transporter